MIRAEWPASLRMAAAIGLVMAVATNPAEAQNQRPARAAAPSNAPVPPTPQQTTASFGDWTLRCTQVGTGPRFCEVVQNIQQNDRPVAQLAVGRPLVGQKLQLTMLVPPNVSLQAGPGLLAGNEGDPQPVVTLAWRRCIPIGCLADAALEHRRIVDVTVTVEKLDLGPGAVGCRIRRRREASQIL